MEALWSDVLEWLASNIWPFVRISSMLSAMLIIGSRMLPSITRLVFAIALTWALIPLVPPSQTQVSLFSLEGAVITANQLLIGTTIGFATEFISQCFILAGQVIAMQTGLGFASVVDPVNGMNTPVVGQFFSMTCALIFFGIDGHLVFINLLRQSFITLPIGADFWPQDTWKELYSFLSVMFQTAVNFSIASICTMIVINFTFGVLTRAAPQLNIFSMGFAVSLIVGVGILWLAMSNFYVYFERQFDQASGLVCMMIGVDCTGGIR